MPDLVPVDTQPEFDHSLVPVDHNPFADSLTMGVDPSTMNPIANVASGLASQFATLPQRAIDAGGQDIQNWNDPNYVPQTIGPAVETAMTMMGGSGAVPAEANSLRMGIKAYHGSPHDFDAFDLSKIGTGEGAQAYGHGLYFADKEATAKAYRDQLSGNIPQLSNKIGATPEYKELNNGHMYQVDINADPENFLDWDKPLSEQHPDVQAAIQKIMPGIEESPHLSGKMSGNIHHLYGELSNQLGGERSLAGGTYSVPYANEAAASAKLQEAGIPGIKYLDQGSRAAGDGSRNYVVFNDKLVNIIKKYGVAGLPAGYAAAASQQFVPVDHDPEF